MTAPAPVSVLPVRGEEPPLQAVARRGGSEGRRMRDTQDQAGEASEPIQDDD